LYCEYIKNFLKSYCAFITANILLSLNYAELLALLVNVVVLFPYCMLHKCTRPILTEKSCIALGSESETHLCKNL